MAHHPHRTLRIDRTDNEITRLQQQLVSHSQRVSHLEYCLLATLDFLDSTRTASANELRLANERCARLQQKISQLKAINSAMENEKDDLRNSVVMLIEKVEENNNDFSCLPYARLRSTRSLSLVPQQTTPIAGPSRITQFQSQSHSNHSQSYAPSIVAELSRQLEVERVAHAQTTAQAENNIALLECAVARRDAEIEKWITKTSDIHASTPIEKDSITPLKRLTEISQEGMRRIDALSQERQDLLENELAVLKGKIRQIEQENQSPVSHVSKRLRSKGVQTSIHETPLPTSTSGVPLVASGSPIAKALQELDRRLGMLRSETQDLERKRGRLAVTVESQLDRKEDTSESAGDTSSDSDFSRVLAIEEECIRLERCNKDLQEELTRVRAESASRESTLEEEITELRKALERIQNAPPQVLTPPPAPILAPEQDTSHAVTYVDSVPDTPSRSMNLTDHPNTTTDSTSTARINSSGASLNLNESFPPLVPDHLDSSQVAPPVPSLDEASMTETETELQTDLDPSEPWGSSPRGGSEPLTEITADADSRFFSEPTSEADRSPIPASSSTLNSETDGAPRRARNISVIEQELAQIREEDARRAREAEELRESIAVLQRIHLQSSSDDGATG